MMEFDRLSAGKVIRSLRKERKLSQEVLSGLAGLARSHLAMLESGAKQPNFETIWRIANALDMPPHRLVKAIEETAAADKTLKLYPSRAAVSASVHHGD